MVLRGFVVLTIFAILCACCADAAYKANCAERAVTYTSAETLEMAVWERTIEALSAVYGSKIDLQHIITLNDTIVPEVKRTSYFLSDRASDFTKEQQFNLSQIAKKANEMYSRIEQINLGGFDESISKAEAKLTSIKDESEKSFCIAEDAFVIGDDIRQKIKPICNQYQEVYDTFESFRQTVKEYDLKRKMSEMLNK